MTVPPAIAPLLLAEPGPEPMPPARHGPRILFVLKSLDPGGAEKVALRLAGGLAGLGADVSLALGNAGGALHDRLPDVPCHVLDARPDRRMSRAELALRLTGLVARLAPDVVVCPGNFYSHVGVVLRLRLRQRTPKLVLKISNDLVRRDLPIPVRWLYHLWLRLQAPFYDSLVAMAPPAVDEVVTMMRPDPARITMIHNPALGEGDAARLAAVRDATPRVRPGRHYLGIGRLARQKNFALMIDSFADFAGPDDRLTILGDGPERPRLAALARQRGVAGQVLMPGHSADVAPHLAAADAFVLSSDYEGLAAVLVEALAAGVPVVSTDCSVNTRWLLGEAAQLVPVGDRAALAAAMQAAVAGARPGDVAARRARARAFGIEASARQWLSHLSALSGRSLRAAPG